jgi:ribokinase
MMRKRHVVGIGQCSLDYLFVIDEFPLPDTKKEVHSWTACGGGPVATALVTLSQLGMDCTFYGIIGDDESGRKIEESLRVEDIEVRGLLKRPHSLSQTAFIAIEKESGKRTIFWKRPSGAPLKPEEIPENFLDNVDFLLLDGLMIETSLFAADRAKSRDIPVMLDAGRVRERMLELALHCDYIVASEEFAIEFNQESRSRLERPDSALSRMKSFGAKACTITLGERGSITMAGDKVFHTPAFRVNVVDTTGAGDVFHGGYICGLLKNWNIEDVVRFATACASLKCKQLGGRAGIPTLDEVEGLIKKKLR